MAFERKSAGGCSALAGAVLLLLGAVAFAGHDPTAPPPEAQPPETANQQVPLEPPAVRAILRSGDRRIAFVGDAYIREGDALDFGRVERIERHAVIFRRAGALVHVPVQGTDIKRNQKQ
ncbi:hypothetical protein HC341_10250 [Aquisalimonas sp. 2447]|uniref:hypothetical protein n=1 Tax=Aquisalimonas sp. 2447 TaxID=2740807 RepID=UPI0014324981|nr:hypothetical protein [Aquisalimonas sp. 2447]QIT55556.1 hypothetical protein HC341_10250 [Aquisalimonas sp. 2447]